MGSFDEFTKDLNLKPVSTRSSLIDQNANGPQQHIDREYNTSGQPLRLSEFGSLVSRNPPEIYNSSGRMFNLTELMADDSRNKQVRGLLKKLNDSTSDSDRTLRASEFSGRTSPRHQGSNRTYNESGRVFRLSDFGSTIIPESRRYIENLTSSFNDPDQRTFIDNTSNAQPGQLAMHPYLDIPLQSTLFQEQPRNPISPTSGSVSEHPTASYRLGKWQETRCPIGIRRAVHPVHLPECPNLSQEQLVQFLQNGELSQISARNPLSSETKNPLFNILVKDNYYPGAIQAAVNGQINFNKVAFDAVFHGENIPSQVEPEEVPMTLLEAFGMRIEYERQLRKNIEGGTPQRKQGRTVKNKDGMEEGEATFWIHPDELKLASTVDVDLASNIRDQPDTDLIRALTSLFKAEKMNDYDKKVHLAEEAIRSASPDGQEKAALRSTCSFKVDLQKDEVQSNKTYTPIEIISYIGTTKPAE